ncbi:hypothetical protein BD410DRAFT_622211 [Rickenella mellea]|uniref:Uncharacterized protein n=1 Tax=Rickenella mellea TaxID=50990 RepID=A0A4Y7PPR0_9AGAM|nr:hypothetical protein BD410DRAFT_622211 [Rickenella mellea]
MPPISSLFGTCSANTHTLRRLIHRGQYIFWIEFDGMSLEPIEVPLWRFVPFFYRLQKAGDILWIAAICLLLYRLLTKGPSGISVLTQCLNLVAFLCAFPSSETRTAMTIRYAELDPPIPVIPSGFDMAVKITSTILTAISLSILLSKIPTPSNVSHHATHALVHYIFPALWVAIIINHAMPVPDIAWGFAQNLLAVAQVPQLLAIYRNEKRRRWDVWMVSYVSLVACWRIAQLPHWINMALVLNVQTDPIAFYPTVVHATIWAEFMLLLGIRPVRQAIYLRGDEEKLSAFESESDDDEREYEKGGLVSEKSESILA